MEGLPSDVLGILEDREEVVWHGKPVRKPFLLKSMSLLFPALFIVVMSVPFLMVVPANVFLQPPVLGFFSLRFGFAFLIALGPFIYNALVWKNLYYVVTDRRIIIRKGVIGIDYDYLDLDLVQQVKVDVGFWDKIYGTATLTILAVGLQPLNFLCVAEPLEVYRVVKEAMNRRKKEGRV